MPGPAATIYQVDSFTDVEFHGNPAAICLLSAERPKEWMQSLAAEMNLSETAFLAPANGDWKIRYFTPTIEVPLCGHATLAAAHVLWQEEGIPHDSAINFRSPAGLLPIRWKDGKILMDFPADPCEPYDTPRELQEALGVTVSEAFMSRLGYVFILLELEAEIRAVTPDFRRLRELGTPAVCVTAKADAEEADFVSRFFAPNHGIDEDPVTGSAHCGLALIWGEKLGKETLSAQQLSRRGGSVGIHLRGDRVDVSGQAVTVLRGELRV